MQVIFGDILTDEEAVDGGWCTEGGDVILLHLSQHTVGSKFLMVVDEDGRSGEPLSIEFSPDGLAPSGVSHREVDAVFA